MKDKLIFQFAVTVASFFGLWFALSQINFTEVLKIEEFSKSNEKKLGELIYKTIKKTSQEIDSDSVKHFINQIHERICIENDIEPEEIKIYVLQNSDINAFALPDNRLVVYSGLIEYCQNAEELSGVMAHEISHIKLNHVMQKLTKEVGIAMLATLASGNSSPDITKEIIRLISSTAFDRKQEAEADASAVEYLANAKIDPEHFANLMFRFSREMPEMPKQLEWISTHPESKDRAAEILNLRNLKVFDVEPILAEGDWERLKTGVSRDWE